MPSEPKPSPLDPLVAAVADAVVEKLADRLAEMVPANDAKPERLLDRSACAAWLDVSLASLDRFVREDGLPFLLLGDSKRFERETVMAWLRGRTG